MPDGYALKRPERPGRIPTATRTSGPKGRGNLKAWVQDGGRYVGWLDGGVLASALGHLLGTVYGDGGDARASPRRAALFRARVNDGSPLAAGVGPFALACSATRATCSARAPARASRCAIPAAGSSDFFVSGLGRRGGGARRPPGRDRDERVGRGRAVAFGFDPNFRAFADGTQKLLRNAMLGADPAAAQGLGGAGGAPRRAGDSDATRRLTVSQGAAAARRTVPAVFAGPEAGSWPASA